MTDPNDANNDFAHPDEDIHARQRRSRRRLALLALEEIPRERRRIIEASELHTPPIASSMSRTTPPNPPDLLISGEARALPATRLFFPSPDTAGWQEARARRTSAPGVPRPPIRRILPPNVDILRNYGRNISRFNEYDGELEVLDRRTLLDERLSRRRSQLRSSADSNHSEALRLVTGYPLSFLKIRERISKDGNDLSAKQAQWIEAAETPGNVFDVDGNALVPIGRRMTPEVGNKHSPEDIMVHAICGMPVPQSTTSHVVQIELDDDSDSELLFDFLVMREEDAPSPPRNARRITSDVER
jgi:hypothetical protein